MTALEYYLVTLGVFGCLNGILALGFNMQFGQSGIINFAYILLVAVGAYGTAIASVKPAPNTSVATYIGGFGWNFPWNLLFGVGCTLVFALLLGAIALWRLRHDYLALTLVAIGQGALELVANDRGLFNGNAGISGIPGPWQSGLSVVGYQVVFLGVAGLCLALVYVIFWRISGSPLGRALKAVREDQEAAAGLGKRVWRLKMTGFLLGAGAAGLGGGLFALYVGAWNPSGWQPVETLALLAAVIVGGRGRNAGALLGALIVFEGVAGGSQFLPTIGSPDLLPGLQRIVIAVLVFAFLWWRPEGVLPEQKERFSNPPRSRSRAPRNSADEIVGGQNTIKPSL